MREKLNLIITWLLQQCDEVYLPVCGFLLLVLGTNLGHIDFITIFLLARFLSLSKSPEMRSMGYDGLINC